MAGLGNIGTGLAGFMQGYRQQQQAEAQQALQRIAIQQAQRQALAQKLLGSANLFSALGGGQPTPPPMPGQPSVPSFPQGSGAPSPAPSVGPSGGGASTPPLALSAAESAAAVPTGDPPIPLDTDTPIGEQPTGGTKSPGVAEGDMGKPADVTPLPAKPTEDTASPRMSMLEQLLNPEHAYDAIGKLRDRIAKAAPPGTDPAVVWEATQQLFKMSSGSAMERAQLGAYLKLAGLDSAEKRQKAALDVRQSEGQANRDLRASEGEANRGVRTSEGDKNRASRESVANARENSRMARFLIARADKLARQSVDPVKKQRSIDIGRKIQALRAVADNPKSTSEQQRDAAKGLQDALKQLDALDPGGAVNPNASKP